MKGVDALLPLTSALRLELVNTHPKRLHFPFAYDTDNSIQAVDVEIKISKAGSDLDPC
jgi:hypothetical protein